MKNQLINNNLRNIKKNLPRFFSLLIMGFLGVFVFAGLKATAPDMLKTLDTYLKNGNVYDIKLVSSGGLTDYDISSIQEIDETKDIEGSYSIDTILQINDAVYVININSLPNKINTLNIISGRLPNNKNEIVIEPNFLKDFSFKLNDTISFNNNSLNSETFTIVGTIDSPLFFNNVSLGQERGTSSIGSGKINYYSYILKDNFKLDYYNSIYVTINDANNYQTGSNQYKQIVDNYIDKINEMKNDLQQHRYQEIYDIYNNEILKNEEELNKTKNILEESNNELIAAKKSLDDGKNKIEENINSINETVTLLSQEELNLTFDNVDEKISGIKQLISDDDPRKNLLEALLNLYLVPLQESINEYNENLAIYNENQKNYNKAYNSYLEAQEEINIAKNELKNLPEITLFVFDLTNNATYSDYLDDSNSIKNLALIFPIVFYAVAILVSLISMNRMVENDRGEIGTLKSLGFSNFSILKKYLLFAFLATSIGGILGNFLGVIIIPKLIFSIYTILFELPPLIIEYNFINFILGLLIALICILGSTFYTTYEVLKERPADLLRPKAPIAGKRVLLEKIPFIWNHLNFSKKITIRNLFRYYKRGLITIFSIAGCTALLLCGFAIRDSIVDIPTKQFGEVFNFDATLQVNNFEIEDEEFLKQNVQIIDYVKVDSIMVNVDNYDVTLIVFENNESLNKVINLVDYQTKESLSLSQGNVIISEKLASLTKLKVGDEIKIIDGDNQIQNYNISGIAKNYINHYIFIDEQTYSLYNKEIITNTIYLKTKSLNDSEKNILTSILLQNDSVLNVKYMEQFKETVANMLKSLDKVVFILIVLSALLALVVLYNLSNININERKREISTLKVLGFYNKEVDSYITKETIILTILGIIIGLVLGYFLSMSVITTIEIERARFIKNIHFISYIYSILIALLFTFIVNFVTHFILKKINMIDSLKSVE